MATQVATEFEELMRWRIALLDRRKMLRRRMRVIDGTLTLVDDIAVTSDSRSQRRSPSLKSMNAKRVAVTDLAHRFDGLDAGHGANNQRRNIGRRVQVKGPVLAKIEKHFASLVTNAPSSNFEVRQRLANLTRRVAKYRVIPAKLLSVKNRQAVFVE